MLFQQKEALKRQMFRNRIHLSVSEVVWLANLLTKFFLWKRCHLQWLSDWLCMCIPTHSWYQQLKLAHAVVLFPVFGRCRIKDFNPFGKIYVHAISCAYYIPTNATCPQHPPHLRNGRHRGKSFFWLWKSAKLSRNPCHWVQSHTIHGTGIFTIDYLHWVDSLW